MVIMRLNEPLIQLYKRTIYKLVKKSYYKLNHLGNRKMAAVTQIEAVRPPASDELYLSCPEDIATISGVARFARAQAEYMVFVPDVVTDPYAAYFSHGFGGIGAGYEDLGLETARRGKIAVVADPAYGWSLAHHLDKRYIKSPEKLPGDATHAVMQKVLGMDGLDIAGFDVVGHSMGGFAGSEAVKHRHRPDKVRSMTFMASAGQYKQNMASLSYRGLKFMVKDAPGIVRNVRPQNATRATRQFIRYWSSPHRRFLEGMAISFSDVTKTARELSNSKIVTSILLFEDDVFFDYERALANMGPVVDIVGHHEDPEAGHGAPQDSPAEVARSLFRVWNRVAELRA